MPDSVPPPRLQEVNLESEPFKFAAQTLEEAYAKSLVVQTFNTYETYRTQACDRRWNTHDSLYTGYTPQKVWDGSNIPRSSLTKMLVFDHVETALPAIDAAIFSNGTEWFQVEPETGADPKEGRAIKDRLLYDYTRSETRKEINLAVKSTLLYGNGGIEVYWDPKIKGIATRWVDIRDFYIDPACSTPSVDEARSIIRVRKMTVEEIKALDGTPGFKLPSDEQLNYFAQNATTTYAENTKRNQEGLRGVNYTPQQWDNVPLPSDKKLEVLIYYSASRIIWIIGREWVAYNEKNPYGFIPFCFAPCFAYLGRFYAISYADVLENPQRYAEALMNAHLDEINLSLHPPRVSKRGGNMTPNTQRWRPGLNLQAEDAKDIQLLQPQPATVNVMDDILAIEIMAEKHTGVNSVGMGIPRPGNANRTLGGIQSQMQGGASRLSYVVKNIEDYMLIPMLEKSYKMLQIFGDKSNLMNLASALGPMQQLIQVGQGAFNAPVRFKMLASSQMLTREKLGQIFQFTTQYLLQGPLVEQLHGIGLTIDPSELFTMMQDATGTGRSYRLIRPMNQQEQQAMGQPPPDVMAKMQQAQQDAQVRLQMGQMKAQTDLQTKQMELAAQAKDHDLARDQDDEESAREMLRLVMGQAADKQRAESDRQKTSAQIQSMREKAQIERDARMQKMFMDAMEGHQKLRANEMQAAHEARRAENDTQTMSVENALKLMFQKEQHEQKMKQMAETAKQKPKTSKETKGPK